MTTSLCSHHHLPATSTLLTVRTTDLHISILDAVPPVHVVSNHVETDKLTAANMGARRQVHGGARAPPWILT